MISLELSDEIRWKALKEYRIKVKPRLCTRLSDDCNADAHKNIPEFAILSRWQELSMEKWIEWCKGAGHPKAAAYAERMTFGLAPEKPDCLDILFCGDYATMKAIIQWFQEKYKKESEDKARPFQPKKLAEHAFHYDTIRKSEYFKKLLAWFYRDVLDVRVCPYCGRNWVTAVPGRRRREKDKNNKALLAAQLDHYFPKEKYPYLAFSLFNLIPVCPICNNHKSDVDTTEWKWYPYEQEHHSTVQFRLNIEEYHDLSAMAFAKIPKVFDENAPPLLKIEPEQMEPCERLNLCSLYHSHIPEVQEQLFRCLQYEHSYWEMQKPLLGEWWDSSGEIYKAEQRKYLLLTEDWNIQTRRTMLGKLMHDIAEQLLSYEEEENS